MRSDELAEKLGKLFGLYGQGKEKKIKHKDLDKIISKLTELREIAAADAAKAKGPKKAEKLAAIRDGHALLLDRATWLAAQIAPAPADTPEPESTDSPADTEVDTQAEAPADAAQD